MKLKLLAFFVLLSAALAAQSSARNFKTVKYEEKLFDNADYKLYIVGGFSRSDILKVKIRVFNKSKHIIYIRPQEIRFIVNGQTFQGKGQPVVVQPDGDEARFIEVEGGSEMRADQFDMILSGVYKIDPKNAEVLKADASEVDGNSAKAVSVTGLFRCNTSVAQTTKEKSFVKYSCVYTGDKIGVIEPGNTVAIMASGQKNYNSFPRNELFVLEKNDAQTITIEFRKLNGAASLNEGYKVIWDNVFSIGKPEAYDAARTTIAIDLSKSEK